MKKKQFYGVVAIAVGVGLICLSLIVNYKVNDAREGFGQVSGLLPKNEVGGFIKKKAGEKLSAYDVLIQWSMIGGIICVAGGIYAAIRFRKG